MYTAMFSYSNNCPLCRLSERFGQRTSLRMSSGIFQAKCLFIYRYYASQIHHPLNDTFLFTHLSLPNHMHPRPHSAFPHPRYHKLPTRSYPWPIISSALISRFSVTSCGPWLMTSRTEPMGSCRSFSRSVPGVRPLSFTFQKRPHPANIL
jgi:hypothetical protein